MDVEYIASHQEFWALLCCYDTGSINVPKTVIEPESDSLKSDKNIPTELYFAKSRDGREWVIYPKSILSPSKTGWDSERIYRSTLVYDSLKDRLRIWYSASNRNKVWHVGYTECDYGQLSDFLDNHTPLDTKVPPEKDGN
jgi:predicted GH43/DUF377 family glycosyl hydrolase